MKIKEKINSLKGVKIKLPQGINYSLILKRCVWLSAGFVLSLSPVSGGISPFAVSLISVSGKRNFLYCALGSALGYISFYNGSEALRYFSAVIIAALGAFAINLLKVKSEPYLSVFLSFCAVLSTGFVMNFRSGALFSQYVLAFAEAVLAAGGSYFFFKSVHCNFKRFKFKALPSTDITCLLISLCILFSSLCLFEINGFSPARAAAVFVMLVAIRFSSQKWGLIISLCLGFAIGISGEESLFLLGAYAFSALTASLFTAVSSSSVCVSFVISIAFFAVLSNTPTLSLCSVFESAAGALLFALLPEMLKSRIIDFFESAADASPDGSLRQSLVVRLRFASSALSQVSESVRDVREKINTIGSVRPMESELRMVAADQFFSISDMLEDLAFEFDEAELFDYKSAGKIRRMLGKYDIFPENISVIIDKYDRMRIEILALSKTRGLDSPRIKDEIEKICGRCFEKSKVQYCSSKMMVSIIERPNYKADFGFAQYSAEGDLCGDTVKVINDSRGHIVFIISDGMGRGDRAALDGAMGAGLLSKLLSAGFGFDSSLKVVNSALLVKSSDESLATLDCASVDLFNGKCEFYKAGAPKSYIKKGDSLTKCELSSMPAGILRGVEFAKRTTVLGVGDELIMMSDGITELDEEKLEEFIKGLYYNEPTAQKAKAILDFAVKNSDSRHLDDMSVIVATLLKQ